MASQIKHSQKLIEEQQSIDRDELWKVVKKIDNGNSNNMMSGSGDMVNKGDNKFDTTAETVVPVEEENDAPSLEWTVDWNLCNTSNNFSANPCGVGIVSSSSNPCAANNLCGAKECWENAFPDNDVFACNDFFDLNAATTNNNNNKAGDNNNKQKDKKNGVVIAEEYNEVIEINDKVAADISAGKDIGSSKQLAVVEWLKDEYMASIGATEVETTLDEKGCEDEGKKEGPSSPTSVLDCAQSTLSSSVAEVTTAISSLAEMPKSMCKQETIVSSTVACCGVFDSIVQIPQSFNDVVTCQLFPESSDDNDDKGKGESSPKSGSGGDKVGNEKILKGAEEVGKVDDYKMVSSEELGLKLPPPPKEDSDSSGCDSVSGLCENIDQVFISEDDEDVIVVDDDNSQPSI